MRYVMVLGLLLSLSWPVQADEQTATLLPTLVQNLPSLKLPATCCQAPKQTRMLSEDLYPLIPDQFEVWAQAEPLFFDPDLSVYQPAYVLAQTPQVIAVIFRKATSWNGFEMDLYELITFDRQKGIVARLELAGKLVTASLMDGSATYHTLKAQIAADYNISVTHLRDYQPEGGALAAGDKPEKTTRTQRWKLDLKTGQLRSQP